MNTLTRLLATLAVVTGLIVVPITASAAPAVDQTAAAKPTKVTARLDKVKVHVNEKAKLSGRFNVDVRQTESADSRGAELLLVQELRPEGWVTVGNVWCRPDGGFSVHLWFSVAVVVQLRVYYPGTAVYASSTSQVLSLLVVG